MRVLSSPGEQRIVLVVHLVDLIPVRPRVRHPMAPKGQEVVKDQTETHLPH